MPKFPATAGALGGSHAARIAISPLHQVGYPLKTLKAEQGTSTSGP